LTASTQTGRKFRIGVIVNEFFCDEYPPLGGFGLSAKTFAEFFNSQPQYNIEVIALLPPYQGWGPVPSELHGTKVVEVPKGLRKTRARLREENIDLLISVDYYPNYFERLVALPRVPWIHWARDPHSPENWDQILTLIGSGYPCEYNEKAKFRHEYYPQLQILRRILNRNFCCAVQETWLAERAEAGFPLVGKNFFRLVNRIGVPPAPAAKTGRPVILFIGRLLPVKRPWVYFEIAKRLPDYEFLVVGEMDKRRHLEPIVEEAKSIPNLSLLGKRTGSDLHEALDRAWLLVNTSIHEGMPQSILETLAFSVPVVSSLDYAGTIDIFGVSVGLTKGNGLKEVDSFVRTISELVDDEDRRVSLGAAGRKFVEQNYSNKAFLEQFLAIMDDFDLETAAIRSTLGAEQAGV